VLSCFESRVNGCNWVFYCIGSFWVNVKHRLLNGQKTPTPKGFVFARLGGAEAIRFEPLLMSIWGTNEGQPQLCSPQRAHQYGHAQKTFRLRKPWWTHPNGQLLLVHLNWPAVAVRSGRFRNPQALTLNDQTLPNDARNRPALTWRSHGFTTAGAERGSGFASASLLIACLHQLLRATQVY
jgi:hypothetical protein